ncbi:MAG: DMT family transporter [Rhodospirillales bacterium]|nr:DMT family transporter [Rhodospirillales bacterium]
MTGTNGAHNIGLGIAAVVAAVFLGSTADAAAKWFGTQGYLSTQVVFLRYVFGLIPVAFFVYHSGVGALQTKRYGLHFVRACLGFGSIGLFFWGIQLMPLAEATAISFTGPLFTTALSVPMLGERVGPRRWAAVAIGFLGALVVVRPGTEAFRPEALIIIASAVVYALSLTLTRRMASTETNVAMFTYTTIVAGIISTPFLMLGWVTPTLPHLAAFSGFGIIEGSCSFLLIIAYRHAPAAVAAPFDYTAIIWATLFGWILWSEQVEPMVWIGAAIIAVSGVYIARREAFHKKTEE